MQNDDPTPAYRIASVDHALQLLLLLRARPAVRVSEVAEELGVVRSTAHRLLAMLVYRGFAIQDTATRHYRPGPVLVEIGMAALLDLDVRRKAQPYLDRIVAETGETASLELLEGSEVRLVDFAESPQAVRVAARVGINMPAHAASGGKAMLALLPEETMARLYPDEELAPVTAATVTGRAELLQELALAREQGYAVNSEETVSGLVAVGVPIGDRHGHPIASFSVAGPAPRMTPEAIEKAVGTLRRAADELRDELYPRSL